jgi:hypothetical protein
MGSETTAAATGKVGVVRRDPMAMLPFCGYNMGTTSSTGSTWARTVVRPPKIFSVNWFRTDEPDGSFLWPGFGENMRVLKWIIDRTTGAAGARETGAGLVPRPQDLDLSGLDIPPARLAKLFDVNMKEWRGEVDEIRAALKPYKSRLPAEIREQVEKLDRLTKFAGAAAEPPPFPLPPSWDGWAWRGASAWRGGWAFEPRLLSNRRSRLPLPPDRAPRSRPPFPPEDGRWSRGSASAGRSSLCRKAAAYSRLSPAAMRSGVAFFTGIRMPMYFSMSGSFDR